LNVSCNENAMVFSVVRVARSLVFRVMFCPLVLSLLAIVLNVLLRITINDYTFGIFTLFSDRKCNNSSRKK